MDSTQAMADTSVIGLTILETGKMVITMALERMCIMMAQPMWVPGNTTLDMVKANKPTKKAQSSKENG